jgi:hypothetical protein
MLAIAALLVSGAAGSAVAGESTLDLGLGSEGWQTADPADAAAGRERAPILGTQPAAGSPESNARPLFLEGADDGRLRSETLWAVEPGRAPGPASRSDEAQPIAPAAQGDFEDAEGLVARQLGLDGIDPADLTGR